MWSENTGNNTASCTRDLEIPRQSVVERLGTELRKRHRAERRFKTYALAAVVLGLGFLAFLLGSIVIQGHGALWQTEVHLNIHFDPKVFEGRAPERADYGRLVKEALYRLFPHVTGRGERRELYRLVSPGARFVLRRMVLENPDLIGRTVEVWVPADDDVDVWIKGKADPNLEASRRRLSDRQLHWMAELQRAGRMAKRFNVTFFTAGDSREPELSGILGATVGSFLTLLITLILSFPLGVAAAVYLEEFAPRNRWTDLIEVNINNLAAVPSIVFGLLGLAVFLNFFGLPRSSPLVGGLVLTLMTLPTIIISSRAALDAVPPSIREAALSVGASKMQVVFHHVFPLALPGMLTGTIIGMARALGETAPLLMIGMVAFIVDIPGGFLDPATALPVQIFLWADSPERAFMERSAAAILVLLLFMIAMNAAAVILRRKYERKW